MTGGEVMVAFQLDCWIWNPREGGKEDVVLPLFWGNLAGEVMVELGRLDCDALSLSADIVEGSVVRLFSCMLGGGGAVEFSMSNCEELGASIEAWEDVRIRSFA
jgi:hypothetical protein